MKEVIGSTAKVAFPSLGIKNVPAKVDTGADSSSIWATDVSLKKSGLTFKLFGPNSKYFTGEAIKTKKFEILSVKNSFGHKEVRFKVKLPLQISNKKVISSFTLADRSANRYPILVGKNTIKGKFLVDVSASEPKKQSGETLVLDIKRIGSVDRFFNKINTSSRHKITNTTFEELEYYIDRKKVKVILRGTNKKLNKFKLVFFKSVVAEKDSAVALAQYLYQQNIEFIDKAILFQPVLNKLAQYVVLANHHIKVPRSLFISPAYMPGSYLKFKNYLGLPFVLKDIKASKGRHNYLINNKKDFELACQKIIDESLQLIGQEYIDNDGDYRILLFGRQQRLVIYRSSDGNSHLNNTSVGGKAKLISDKELPPQVIRDSIHAADLLKLDIAGVDMVRDKKTGIWYCFEVNHGPQITSGAFVDEKRQAFTKYLDRKSRRTGQ